MRTLPTVHSSLVVVTAAPPEAAVDSEAAAEAASLAALLEQPLRIPTDAAPAIPMAAPFIKFLLDRSMIFPFLSFGRLDRKK